MCVGTSPARSAAGERVGTYTSTIEAEGFEPVTIEDIVIETDECHVIGVTREEVVLTAP